MIQHLCTLQMIITVSLVTICHHTKFIQYYWPYYPCCTLHPHDLFILQLEVCTSWSLSPICPPPLPFALAIHQSVFCMSLHYVLFFFLDSTYNWNHVVFFFLCLTYSLSMVASRFVHIVSGKISFFLFGWVVFFSLSPRPPYFLYPFTYQWILRLFSYLDYSAVLNIGLHVSFWTNVFVFSK